ncbi:MAG: DUF2325 domain-containing protein [Eubacteriales bacterium]
MSVVIAVGNKCMIRQYKNPCSEYQCRAAEYSKSLGGLKDLDLPVLFTNTVSHKMIGCASGKTEGQNVRIACSHASTVSALKNILEEHTASCR